MSDEKVVVGQEVWSDEDEFGGSRLLAAPGDLLHIDEAKRRGVETTDLEVTHVVAPRDVWSEPDEFGGSHLLVAAGDTVHVDEAKKHGIDVSGATVVRRAPKRKVEAAAKAVEAASKTEPPEAASPVGLTTENAVKKA